MWRMLRIDLYFIFFDSIANYSNDDDIADRCGACQTPSKRRTDGLSVRPSLRWSLTLPDGEN